MDAKKTLCAGLLACLPLCCLAEETQVIQTQTTQQNESGVQRSTVTQETVRKQGLRDQALGILLQAGFMNLNEGRGVEDNTRAVGGLGIDGNFAAGVDTGSAAGKPFLGPSIAVFYAKPEDAHLLQIPLNIKAGYTFRNVMRLSAHGGVNLTYLNTPGSATTTSVSGTTVTTTTSSFRNDTWETNPNIGFDLEFGLGDSGLFLIRPDWTLKPEGGTFMGTIGFGFTLT